MVAGAFCVKSSHLKASKAVSRHGFGPSLALAGLLCGLGGLVQAEDLAAANSAEGVAQLLQAQQQTGGLQDLLPTALQPGAVIQLPASMAHVLVADLERNRLHLYHHTDGQLQLLNSMFLSIGKAGYGKQVEGDNLSPVGIYTITSWLSGESLPPLYGDGAWPVDYPNSLDRFEGRTGHGIWLHGNPPESDHGKRAARSSEGCLTLANADLTSLTPFIELQRTTVIFADQVNWISPAERLANQRLVNQLLEQWQVAWETLDAEELGAFYAPNSRISGLSREQFVAQKRDVNSRKDWIKLQLSELVAYRYPGGPAPRLMLRSQQDSRSSNYSSRGQKRQYWQQQPDGQWKILLEENLG